MSQELLFVVFFMAGVVLARGFLAARAWLRRRRKDAYERWLNERPKHPVGTYESFMEQQRFVPPDFVFRNPTREQKEEYEEAIASWKAREP